MIAPVIGLLGGSFDPIHVGHLQLARDALAHLPLDEVRFIPAAQPWQKERVTDAAHRAHMVELAIAHEPRCVLDMHEIERGGTTYTIDTLRDLRAGPWPDASLVLVHGIGPVRTVRHLARVAGHRRSRAHRGRATRRRRGAPQPDAAGVREGAPLRARRTRAPPRPAGWWSFR